MDAISSSKAAAEAMQRSAEDQVKKMLEENQQLKESLGELEDQRKALQNDINSLREEGERMWEKLKRCEVSYKVTKALPWRSWVLGCSEGESKVG